MRDAEDEKLTYRVMLNKGPHILTAISLLDNILRRMQGRKHRNQ